jgi:hypothetical protein
VAATSRDGGAQLRQGRTGVTGRAGVRSVCRAESWLPAAIGVVGALAGTVVGAVITQRLQRRTVAYTQRHEERLIAYSAFAAALLEYRRAVTERAALRGRANAPELGAAGFPARTAAWSGYYRVRFLGGSPTIAAAAELALKAAGAPPQTDDQAERDNLARACREAVEGFVDPAAT